MPFLNYHHLRYFRAIAQTGNLTRAAENLHISPSALSTQLAQLEKSLGQKLFQRINKRLILSEAGRLTLDYAETIFNTGDELFDALKNRAPRQRQVLRIGSEATLSRNFQMEMIRPILKHKNLQLVLRTGSLRELLGMLEAHTIDLIFSNRSVPHDENTDFHSHLVAEQEVSLVGHPQKIRFRFPDSLRDLPMVLPSIESTIRGAFDILMQQYGIRPIILAEVNDMAMLRLLARETEAVTLVPPVVVRDELINGSLVELHRIKQIRKDFYAITPSRKFPNMLVQKLIESSGKRLSSKRPVRKKSAPL